MDLIEQGLQLLHRGLTEYPEGHPERAYREKNFYFNDANNFGYGFLRRDDLRWFAEIYYQKMLDEILIYEARSEKRENKGIVYANLGISQIWNGKLDDGIANFFAAEYEDLPYVKRDNWDILDTKLWWQFESLVAQFISSFVGEDVLSEFRIDEEFWKEILFKEMQRQDRIFFDGTVLALYRNWDVFRRTKEREVEQNAYTLGQLYSGLRDLCLSTLSLLRHKRGLDSGELAVLLENALRDKGIGYPQEPKLETSANSVSLFLKNLDRIIRDANNSQVLRIYCLRLCRNFTIHNSEMIEEQFFEKYELVLGNVFAAILYLKTVGAI